MQSLAIKYRPTTFSDVCSQGSITAILENQILTRTFKQAYIFTGPAGCGKTTCARILANEINNGHGNPIELDAASNNSVDNIREITAQAKTKSLDSEYKVYILDEVHMLSAGAWAAMLKLIEEPPAKTVFILATTDIQKVPNTILSRCQRFDFARIPIDVIIDRLKDVIRWENEAGANIQYTDEALNYIASLADGGMRAALTLTDKVLSYDSNIDIEAVIKALGTVDYNTMFNLYKSILDTNDDEVIKITEGLYFDGKDLKQFMKSFMVFVLDMRKYQITGTLEYTGIPSTYKTQVTSFAHVTVPTADLLDVIVQLNADLKWETNAKALIEATLISFIERSRKLWAQS